MRRMIALAVCALLAAVPAVGSAAEPTLRERQWGLDTVRAPEAWAQTQGRGTVVAVVDTGVDLSHPDLASRLLRDADGRVVGLDLVDGGAPQDEHGHGTQVASVVAAAGEATGDLTGVAPDAWIMPVRVLDANGAGRGADIDEGIRWAVDHGADVVNLSLESAIPLPGQVLATGPDRAVRYAWERGVPVVAASGNSGTPFTDYPSSSPVLLVGASDRDDRRAAFSDGRRSDMVHAPGVEILASSCAPCGDDARPTHREVSGTSFAAPHVAGALALLRARGLDAAEAVSALRDTAAPLAGGAPGHGRIDVAAALGLDEPTPSGATGDAGESSGPGSSEPPEPSEPSGSGGDAPAGDAPSGNAPSEDTPPAAPDVPARSGPSADASAPAAPDRGDPERDRDADPAPGTDVGEGTDASGDDPAPAPAPDTASETSSGTGPQEPRPEPDRVALPESRPGPRVGPLEGLAAGLVTLTGLAVGAVWRGRPDR